MAPADTATGASLWCAINPANAAFLVTQNHQRVIDSDEKMTASESVRTPTGAMNDNHQIWLQVYNQKALRQLLFFSFGVLIWVLPAKKRGNAFLHSRARIAIMIEPSRLAKSRKHALVLVILR